MHSRIQILFLSFVFILAAVILRLSYWQIVRADDLAQRADGQYASRDILDSARGSIITADNFPLVVNRAVYVLGAYLPAVKERPDQIVDLILPKLKLEIDDPAIATDSAKLETALKELELNTRLTMLERLDKSGYVTLARSISVQEKSEIEALGIEGLVFDQSFIRAYPEASLSAQLTGFVGRDDLGKPTGYFGLEGFYNRELEGRSRIEKQEKGAGGNPLLTSDFQLLPGRDGRTLKLFLERGTGYIVEEELKKGLERYGASSGEVIVMDPHNGAILAMASLPAYDPAKFHLYDPALYKNPAVANTYEPGSTFKVLVMAAALNEGVISENDRCDICKEPYTIGKYTIKTWNNEYQENASPEDIIVHSDNVGMVWVEQKLGGDKFLEYIKNFGFGEKTGIDLQEEVASSLRSRWGDIDYATASFGQGIAVTSVQMIRAVASIANGGYLLEPHIVQAVIGEEGGVTINKKVIRQVISQEAADKVTEFMVQAVEKGESQWAAPKGYTVAGKTGTAQVAVEGHYDREKTITSFVGFAPAHNPRFVMIVKLREPQSSQWGSETAAPLWFNIAKKLLLHYNIPPDKAI